MSDDLRQVLQSQSNALTTIGNAVLERDKPKLAGALADMLVSLASDIPVLGKLADKAFWPKICWRRTPCA